MDAVTAFELLLPDDPLLQFQAYTIKPGQVLTFHYMRDENSRKGVLTYDEARAVRAKLVLLGKIK